MTINGAIACQLDDRIGTIEFGKDADLVELEADPVVDPPTSRHPRKRNVAARNALQPHIAVKEVLSRVNPR